MKEQKQDIGIMLPKKTEIDNADLSKLCWLIYGQPGIGKSTFASQFPKPLFLSTDPGLKFINAYKIAITSWALYMRILKKLTSETPTDYQTIVIDTIDNLFTMCKSEICKKRGIEHQSDEEWGKGYDIVNTEFTQGIVKLTLLGYGIVFISHDKSIEIKGRVVKTSKITPSIPAQAQKIIMPLADIIGYCGFSDDAADTEERSRIITFEPSEIIDAKCRGNLLPASCGLDLPSCIKAATALLKKQPVTKQVNNKRVIKL